VPPIKPADYQLNPTGTCAECEQGCRLDGGGTWRHLGKARHPAAPIPSTIKVGVRSEEGRSGEVQSEEE
jgi:hypothetical protein